MLPPELFISAMKTFSNVFYFVLLVLELSGIIFRRPTEAAKVAIQINQAVPIRTVSKEFLSVTLDTNLLRLHWHGIIWWKAVILARALSPAYVRIGGTCADLLMFEEIRVNETSFNSSSFSDQEYDPAELLSKAPFTNFNFTAGELDRLQWFVKSSNLSAFFDFNALLRTQDGRWDWRENAASLLNYAQEQLINFNFELGNEPDRYPVFNRSVPPERLADDYETLRSLTRKKFPYYSASKIIGPSVTKINRDRSIDYFQGFLKYGGARSVDALTFHHYYFNGKTATAEHFLNPTTMDTLSDEIEIGKDLIKQYVPDKPDFPLWLGETADSYGGGAAGFSDAFISGFLWLDKLGLGALHGLDSIFRQSFFGSGHYDLLDQQTEPRSNYWVSLLYKRLVGRTVMKLKTVTSPLEYRNYTRFYAHYDTDRVTIFGMNLLNDTLNVDLLAAKNPVSFLYYLLSAPEGDLLSKSLLLNGQQLVFNGSNIPPMRGIQLNTTATMPPFTLAFFVTQQPVVECNVILRQLCQLCLRQLRQRTTDLVRFMANTFDEISTPASRKRSLSRQRGLQSTLDKLLGLRQSIDDPPSPVYSKNHHEDGQSPHFESLANVNQHHDSMVDDGTSQKEEHTNFGHGTTSAPLLEHSEEESPAQSERDGAPSGKKSPNDEPRQQDDAKGQTDATGSPTEDKESRDKDLLGSRKSSVNGFRRSQSDRSSPIERSGSKTASSIQDEASREDRTSREGGSDHSAPVSFKSSTRSEHDNVEASSTPTLGRDGERRNGSGHSVDCVTQVAHPQPEDEPKAPIRQNPQKQLNGANVRSISLTNLSAATALRKQAYEVWLKNKESMLKDRSKHKLAELKKEMEKAKEKTTKRQEALSTYASWKKKKDEELRATLKSDRIRVAEKEKEEKQKREEKIKDADKTFQSWKKAKDESVLSAIRERRKSESDKLEKKKRDERQKRADALKTFEEWKRKKDAEVSSFVRIFKKAERQHHQETFAAQIERDMEAQKCFELWLEQKEKERMDKAMLAQISSPGSTTSLYSRQYSDFKPPWIPCNPTVPKIPKTTGRRNHVRSRSVGTRL